MEHQRRLHRLYGIAIVAVWLEVVLGVIWLAGRRMRQTPVTVAVEKHEEAS